MGKEDICTFLTKFLTGDEGKICFLRGGNMLSIQFIKQLKALPIRKWAFLTTKQKVINAP